MSRIPLDHKPTPLLRIAEMYSKRRYGAVLQPGLALLHNRRVLLAMMGYENGWRAGTLSTPRLGPWPSW
jgi:hypothetical protein